MKIEMTVVAMVLSGFVLTLSSCALAPKGASPALAPAEQMSREPQSMSGLVPEVWNLEIGGVVPPDVYTRYSPEAIAKTIVARVRSFEKNPSHCTSYDYRKNTVLQ